MKEEREVYYDDLREKAITARSAHNRPRRGKTRSKVYTAKELRDLNGSNYSVNLGKPMTYDAFKGLPNDLQKEYVKNLIEKYDAGPTEIARVLGANMKTCASQLRRLGFSFNRGHKQSEENKAQLRADYGVSANVPTKKMTLQNVSLSFSGAFDPSELVKQISAFLPAGQEARVSLVVKVVESV